MLGTNLAAFVRMDGAWLGSIDIAINKAFTARAFDISTLELGRNSQPGDRKLAALMRQDQGSRGQQDPR